MQCSECLKTLTEPDDHEEIRDKSNTCHWCSKNASCMHCDEYIHEDEAYQYCGTSVYLCESCGNKPSCSNCEEIIDNDPVVHGENKYHDTCVPD